MSRKPVKVLDKSEIDKLLEGHSRSEWSDALGVTIAALDKWIQRNRVPEEYFSRLARIKEKLKISAFSSKSLSEVAAIVISEEGSAKVNERFQSGMYSKEAAEALRGTSEGLSSGKRGDLANVGLDRLVDEIEARGWAVSLSRKMGGSY